MSKQKTSMAPVISTIIVAVLAIVVTVIAVLMITGNRNNSGTDSGGASQPGAGNSEPFRPTQELVDECTYAAHDLVADSYRVVRLFITDGLPHFDEPYGNKPEDGIYTVDSREYTSLEQIREFVSSVYTEEAAERVLTDIDGNGLAVYQNREILVTVEETYEGTGEASTAESGPKYKTETVLGISADFVPATDYTKDWSSCRIAIVPVSETECSLTVYLDGLDPDTATEADKDSILNMSMVKLGEEWRLTEFVY